MCHHRHHHRRTMVRDVSDEPRHASPTEPASMEPGLRASDAERESIVAQLREHGAAGRLDVDELEQRIGAAYAARTHGELRELLADLPARRPARSVAAPGARHRPRDEWAGFLAVNVLLVAIWAVSGAGYFWPAWVMVWWAFALVMKSRPGLLRLR
jgi:Domain of unknown function (DUF1707)